MLRILPYKFESKSARTLSKALGSKRIMLSPPRPGDVILNWGCSNPEFNILNNRVLNLPISIKAATNKIKSLECFKAAEVSCPDFTTDTDVAQQWCDEGHTVIVRHSITSHSGNGIEVVEPNGWQEVPYAPLYTKYINKKMEFRVHVFYGQVIDYTQKKKRKTGADEYEYNKHIRNHGNGWVFCRNDIERIQVVKDVAVKAVAALRLDFGAVDVIYKDGKAWALEVNTAPGLDGETVNKYAVMCEEIEQHYNRGGGSL
jgi:hypothetical protein